MKEILEGINLPKQILDKTEKLISTIFGPAAKELNRIILGKAKIYW